MKRRRLGGGHPDVKVLAERAGPPPAGCDVHLATPCRRRIGSGMPPGWIAGHCPVDACAIELAALAARTAVTPHETAGVGRCDAIEAAAHHWRRSWD